jgi:hypothetical protein
MEFQNFTSLPPDQEASFIVFEQRGAENEKSAFTIGMIAAIAVGLIILLISFTVTPKEDARDREAAGAAGSQVQKAESGQ